MTRMIIHKSKRKATLITAAGFVTGIAGGLLMQHADNIVIGWCFLITAILTLILGFGSLFDKRPYIVLTEHGITELFSIREEIEWEAILHTDDFFFRGQYFVRILLGVDYKPQFIQPSWFWRFDRIYEKEGMKAVYIRTSGLEINSMQLVALIERMRMADAAQRTEILASHARRLG